MGYNPVIVSYVFLKAYRRLSTCLLVWVPGLRFGLMKFSAMNSIFDFRKKIAQSLFPICTTGIILCAVILNIFKGMYMENSKMQPSGL